LFTEILVSWDKKSEYIIFINHISQLNPCLVVNAEETVTIQQHALKIISDVVVGMKQIPFPLSLSTKMIAVNHDLR
jgi:hypothetical protein